MAGFFDLDDTEETLLTMQNIEPQEVEISTDGCINARRDYILGLWAGRQLGLRDDELQHYVRDVMHTDQMTPGFDPMINKVATDFSKNGIALANTQIRVAFLHAERTARAEMLATD
uniref:ATPase inhibitor subunit zeta n=1 Tax=Pararhizobium sp. IMCC3301 TaxID=3067904 RepID=UPI0027429292|nr:ATPase inhibitor subunit zeta [Pararhizobium sp. IMCC3301]